MLTQPDKDVLTCTVSGFVTSAALRPILITLAIVLGGMGLVGMLPFGGSRLAGRGGGGGGMKRSLGMFALGIALLNPATLLVPDYGGCAWFHARNNQVAS